jgi:hypothetical protein
MLSDMLLKKCLEEKISLPGVSIFQRFISKIVEQAEDACQKRQQKGHSLCGKHSKCLYTLRNLQK